MRGLLVGVMMLAACPRQQVAPTAPAEEPDPYRYSLNGEWRRDAAVDAEIDAPPVDAGETADAPIDAAPDAAPPLQSFWCVGRATSVDIGGFCSRSKAECGNAYRMTARIVPGVRKCHIEQGAWCFEFDEGKRHEASCWIASDVCDEMRISMNDRTFMGSDFGPAIANVTDCWNR